MARRASAAAFAESCSAHSRCWRSSTTAAAASAAASAARAAAEVALCSAAEAASAAACMPLQNVIDSQCEQPASRPNMCRLLHARYLQA